MNIALSQDVEAFLEEQVRTGACRDASSLVNDVLRTLSKQRTHPFALTPQLEAALLEAADSPTSPLVHEDFEGIQRRVRERLGGQTT